MGGVFLSLLFIVFSSVGVCVCMCVGGGGRQSRVGGRRAGEGGRGSEAKGGGRRRWVRRREGSGGGGSGGKGGPVEGTSPSMNSHTMKTAPRQKTHRVGQSRFGQNRFWSKLVLAKAGQTTKKHQLWPTSVWPKSAITTHSTTAPNSPWRPNVQRRRHDKQPSPRTRPRGPHNSTTGRDEEFSKLRKVLAASPKHPFEGA